MALDPAAFELSYWDSIKSSTNPDDFKAYLEKYPAGQFATLAKNRIKNLEVATKPAEPEPTSRNSGGAEIVFWDSVKSSTNPEDFRAYLKKYPNGEFAELAKNRLQPLEAAIREKEKEEESKRIATQAAKPTKTFNINQVLKGGMLAGDTSYPVVLRIFKTRFLIDLPGEFKEPKEEDLKKHDEVYNCRIFEKARVDGVWIREIRMLDFNWRFGFQSASEAADALGEIQRICKAHP